MFSEAHVFRSTTEARTRKKIGPDRRQHELISTRNRLSFPKVAVPSDHSIFNFDLLRGSAERDEIELIGYCLMSNHVHLIATPRKANVLGTALKDAHGGMLSTGTRRIAVAVTFGMSSYALDCAQVRHRSAWVDGILEFILTASV